MQLHENFCQRGMTCARCHAALAGSCLLDHQRWLQCHGVGDVVEIWRGRHHRRMDLGELLRGAVTAEANRVAQALVPRRHSRIDPQEASEVDLACGLDLELCEGDAADGALRHIAHSHASIERREQVFLGVGEGVAATQFIGFVDVEREPARDLCAADREARDVGTAPGLTLPGRGDTPGGLALRGVLLDTGEQCHEIIDVDTVDDVGFGSCYRGVHDTSPLPSDGEGPRRIYCKVASAAWMRCPWSAVIKLESTFLNIGCAAPEWMYCHR